MNYIVVPGIKEEYRGEFAPVITPELIIETVCNHYKISPEKLKSKNRSKELVHTRHVIFYFLRKYTNITLKAAGLLFNRDHTTVIHSVEHLGDIMDTEPNVKSEVEQLEAIIKLG